MTRRHRSAGNSMFLVASGSMAGRDERDALGRQLRQHELVHREHDRLVLFQEGTQQMADIFVRCRTVDVTTPHPFGAARAREMSNGRRLRIVHDVQIVVVAERLRTPAR